jgi:hypothetical protein
MTVFVRVTETALFSQAGSKRKAEDFSGAVVVFTGFRSAELEVALKVRVKYGSSSVTKMQFRALLL